MNLTSAVAGSYQQATLLYVPKSMARMMLAVAVAPAQEAAKLIETLARAMQPAQRRNEVHRDLKPVNFLGSEPFPVLTQSPPLAALCSNGRFLHAFRQSLGYNGPRSKTVSGDEAVPV